MQHNGKIKKKGQTTIYKALHQKLKIKQHEPHQKPGVISDAPEGKVVPVSNTTLY